MIITCPTCRGKGERWHESSGGLLFWLSCDPCHGTGKREETWMERLKRQWFGASPKRTQEGE